MQAAGEALRLHFDRSNGALDATKGLELDLFTLLRQHPAVFAEQAEQATQRASEALDYLWDAMRDAQEAWQAAGAAWLPFCQAHGIAGVPPFPLQDPSGALADLHSGTLVPRPHNVTV